MPVGSPPPKLPPGEYLVVGGEEPDRKKATFRLMGERLDPDLITEALELTPASSHRTGEARGSGVAYRSGLWSLESLDSGDAKMSMEAHLAHLLDQLEPRVETIRQLCLEHDLKADFFCAYFMHQWNSGFVLCTATLERIAALNASLGFDVYGPSPGQAERTVVVA